MKSSRLFSSALLVCLTAAIGQKSTINFNGTGMLLASNGAPAQIVADQSDWPAVLRVCDDLAMDFGRVTGTNGSVTLLSNGTTPTLNSSMIFNVTGRTTYRMSSNSYGKGGVIVAGTIGNSSIIDRLVSEGKIDVSGVAETWEAYVSTVVADPMPGVSQALVIAGKLHVTEPCVYMAANGRPNKDLTVGGPCTACTAFRSRSEFRLGTTGRIRHPRSTTLSTLQTSQWSKAHRQ